MLSFGEKVKERNVDIYLMGVKIFDISTKRKDFPIHFCLSEDDIYEHARILNKKVPDYE